MWCVTCVGHCCPFIFNQRIKGSCMLAAPLPFETTGVCGPVSLAFLTELAQRLALPMQLGASIHYPISFRGRLSVIQTRPIFCSFQFFHHGQLEKHRHKCKEQNGYSHRKLQGFISIFWTLTAKFHQQLIFISSFRRHKSTSQRKANLCPVQSTKVITCSLITNVSPFV